MNSTTLEFGIQPPEVGWQDWEQVILYGAGSLGAELSRQLRARGIRVAAFLDQKKRGMCAGIPVWRPEELPAGERQNPVVIAVFSAPAACESRRIRVDLSGAGYREVWDFEQLVQAGFPIPENFGFWLARPDYFRAHRKELEAAYRCFEEPASRRLFAAQLRHRLGAPAAELPVSSPLEHQYFDPGIPLELEDFLFFDLGAWEGDTLQRLRTSGLRPRRVLAFEPELENFRALCRWIRANRDWGPELLVIPAGVGDRCAALPFVAAGTSSRFDAGAAASVPVVVLDEVVHFAGDSYIKLDIEGAEEAALRGMSGLIRRLAPRLAVSVYHRPQDLFALVLLLRAWQPRYRFYLRNYAAHGLETVLYAIPD